MANDNLKALLQYRWELFGFIMSLVRRTDVAEDLFQEVAAIVVERGADAEPLRDFKAWAREVAHRQVLKHFRDDPARRSVPLPELVDAAAQACAEESADADAEHDALRRCLQELPPRTTDLLRQRFVSDREYDEISTSAGLSEGAVRRAVARARQALLDCVRRRLKLAEQGG
jgi:RNA polymerase sigma-70 factor, ECF subfamily